MATKRDGEVGERTRSRDGGQAEGGAALHARGAGGEGEGGSCGGAALDSGADRFLRAARPGGAVGGAGGDAGAGAGADPLRPDAGLPVRFLPRRGADHGGGSGAYAVVGSARAVVRRRAPVQLRRVRLARAEPRLRHQRLRRDGAGAVGVGREAAGGELRDRRTRDRVLGEGTACGRARHRSRLQGGDERLRADAEPRTVVLAPVGRAGHGPVHRRRRPEAAEEG